MVSIPIHTKFNIPRNRVGSLLTGDELLIIFNEAKAILEASTEYVITVEDSGGFITLSALNDLDSIVISQHHYYPTALVQRELGRRSNIKTPSAKRLTSLVKTYLG